MQRIAVYARQICASSPQGKGLEVSSCAADADLVKEMAPTGKLRVAINMRNNLLVTGKTGSGDPEGLAPSLGAAFAECLGVPVEYVPYDNAAKLADDAAEDKWDIGMIGADPDRATHVTFTAPYCQIEATFCVPTTSGARNGQPIMGEVDKESVTIASCAGAAYTLWLERNLKNAKLVKIEGHDETYAEFKENNYEVLAGLRSKLKKDASKRPATRLMKDKFMAVEQAACTKKGRDKGFKALSDFIEEAKKSGKVMELMKKFKVDKDLTVP